MRKTVGCWVLVLMNAVAGCGGGTKIPNTPIGQVPALELRALSEEAVRFPSALSGHCNMLVLSFDDPQQPTAREWISHLRSTRAALGAIWDVPVVDAPGFLEGTIRSAMTKERADAALRRGTVPIFASSEPLEKALEIPNKTQVWVGVASQDGKLVGAVRGAWSAEREAEVARLAMTCQPSAAGAAAGRSDAPEPVAPLKTVSVPELAAMNGKPGTFVYDCNGADLYAQGHVPGATMMPYDQVTMDKLPQDKKATLVFYCYNKQCTASVAAGRAASKLGYTNVLHLAEGITGWQAAGQAVAK
jgi:rhodanese-related sulfurtransferase